MIKVLSWLSQWHDSLDFILFQGFHFCLKESWMYPTQSLPKNFEKGINPRLLQHDDMSLLFELAWKLQCTWEPVAIAFFDIETHCIRWKICPGMQSCTPLVKSTNSNLVSMVEILLIKEHLPRTVTPALHIPHAHCHTHTPRMTITYIITLQREAVVL